MDGWLLDVTRAEPADRAEGAFLISEHGRYGPGGRSDYAPDAPDDAVWVWRGDYP
ncbi:hypothetical protein ABT160_44400 [Streptomyces sp. NPDC001941]|uniref:hypothetical protein n=1 Tax=Streptomyces sp. NPDC001941 TaxID=3154659 RepID=UPI00331E5C46